MAIEVKLPELADGVESADILGVLVKQGESVKKNQSVVEIETDKATAEIPTPHDGKVTQIHVSPGQTVNVGAVLLTLEATERVGGGAAPQAGPPAAAKEPTASQETPQPAARRPAASEAAAKPAPYATDAHTDLPPPAKKPAATPPPAPSPVSASAPTGPRVKPRSASGGESPAAAPDGRPVAAGPAIRRFAREVGVDLSTIQGTGDGGRITRDDVLEMVRRANRTASQLPHAGSGVDEVSVPGTPSHDDWGAISIEPASRMRRTIAAKMHESWSTVPRVTNFDDADVTELEKIRESSRADYASRGLKLTSMPFIVKATSMALRKHPLMNASYDLEQEAIVYKRYVSIGVAMDTERGLVVPALRNTDHLSISEIARELSKMVSRVRENEFSIDDLRGSTFSISNLGAIGGTYSTPIVNYPEVAILLVGRSRKMPVILHDQVAVRLMMPLSLSYDHRVIDGATAARFLNDLISYLEEPGRLLLAP